MIEVLVTCFAVFFWLTVFELIKQAAPRWRRNWKYFGVSCLVNGFLCFMLYLVGGVLHLMHAF